MKTIYKYPLAIMGEQSVQMPEYAAILRVGMQAGQLCLWAEVNTDKPIEKRTIEIFGTGHEMTKTHKDYIGTAIDDQNGLVWHVFERLS